MNLSEILEEVRELYYQDNFPVTIGGYKINICHDDTSENPREWCSPFTMVCGHSRYNLGDEQWKPQYPGEYAMFQYFHGMSGLFPDKGLYEDFTEEELQRLEEWADENILWLPLFLYDHSGLSIKTTSFHNRWDSGMVGFIYITREKVREEWKWNRITKQREEKIYEYMRNDVRTYDEFLRGEVYYFSVEYGDELIDSCCGIYGDWTPEDSYMKQEYLIPAITHHYDERKKSRFEKIKALIRNKVPINNRPQLIPNL